MIGTHIGSSSSELWPPRHCYCIPLTPATFYPSTIIFSPTLAQVHQCPSVDAITLAYPPIECSPILVLNHTMSSGCQTSSISANAMASRIGPVIIS
ncbi:hypothetical protein IG631_22864 [Alternaria alternata]|nr:hypothetical protein IG631_22864 [Alternaria alternata]